MFNPDLHIACIAYLWRWFGINFNAREKMVAHFSTLSVSLTTSETIVFDFSVQSPTKAKSKYELHHYTDNVDTEFFAEKGEEWIKLSRSAFFDCEKCIPSRAPPRAPGPSHFPKNYMWGVKWALKISRRSVLRVKALFCTDTRKRITSLPLQNFLHTCEGERGKFYEP